MCVKSWITFLKEPTAFEENIVYNKARLPSFTFCPAQGNNFNSNRSIENFEDIQKAIEKTTINYNIKYTEHKPYEKFKTVEEKYNGTSNGVWYFAPKISGYHPFQTVICLIFTPPRNYRLKHEWSFTVCSYGYKIYKSYSTK